MTVDIYGKICVFTRVLGHSGDHFEVERESDYVQPQL